MFIFTTSSMFPSAKALALSLSSKLGRKVHVTTRADTSLLPPVIRWGNSSPLTSRYPTIQVQELVSSCTNKHVFSVLMRQLRIPCVELYRTVPERYPIVIRKTLTGYGGIGIELCHNRETYASRFQLYHWSQWYDLEPELGVHIFEGRVLKVFKKVRNEGLPTEKFPIRNASRGYSYSRVNLDNFQKLIPFVKEFHEKFPILFGRMDVGWDRENKTYRIIEFNTAPGIRNNPDTLEAYASSLAGVL